MHDLFICLTTMNVWRNFCFPILKARDICPTVSKLSPLTDCRCKFTGLILSVAWICLNIFSLNIVTSDPVSINARALVLSNEMIHDVGSLGVLRLMAFPNKRPVDRPASRGLFSLNGVLDGSRALDVQLTHKPNNAFALASAC